MIDEKINKKKRGLTGNRTQIAGFKVLSHNHLDHKTS
jgi:hypothetical protein